MNTTNSLVTIEYAIPLADSREIALTLGIDHRSFFRMITEYQEEIEQDTGKVRFQITPSGKTNQPQKYALLTEEQTYAYMSYSKNTEQARACKRKLVKAFMEAKAQLQASPQPAINLLWDVRMKLFYRDNAIPLGYWAVFGYVASHCFEEAFRGVHLEDRSQPDVSVGICWCEYLRTHGYDMNRIWQYQHRYPDQRGCQWANIYPDEWLGIFKTWFESFYLKVHWPKYVATHQLQITAPEEHKQLPPVHRRERRRA